MQYQFIEQHQSDYRVDEMCECFALSRSGYYSWSEREPSARAVEDEVFKERICELHRQAKGRYGHRPIHSHLQDEQFSCGRDRTLRLMQELGIAGVQKSGFKPLGTDSNHSFGYSTNLLKELGKPERPNQVWVADTTYLRTQGGWSYLATVMDLFSRRIVGWSVSNRNDSKLVCQALQAAVLTRGGEIPKGLIHHSDRGSQYLSIKYTERLAEAGIDPSVGSIGDSYDNALAESTIGLFKTEVIDFMGPWKSVGQVEWETLKWVNWYNTKRLHSKIGYITPQEAEENFYETLNAAEKAA